MLRMTRSVLHVATCIILIVVTAGSLTGCERMARDKFVGSWRIDRDASAAHMTRAAADQEGLGSAVLVGLFASSMEFEFTLDSDGTYSMKRSALGLPAKSSRGTWSVSNGAAVVEDMKFELSGGQLYHSMNGADLIFVRVSK